MSKTIIISGIILAIAGGAVATASSERADGKLMSQLHHISDSGYEDHRGRSRGRGRGRGRRHDYRSHDHRHHGDRSHYGDRGSSTYGSTHIEGMDRRSSGSARTSGPGSLDNSRRFAPATGLRLPPLPQDRQPVLRGIFPPMGSVPSKGIQLPRSTASPPRKQVPLAKPQNRPMPKTNAAPATPEQKSRSNNAGQGQKQSQSQAMQHFLIRTLWTGN